MAELIELYEDMSSLFHLRTSEVLSFHAVSFRSCDRDHLPATTGLSQGQLHLKLILWRFRTRLKQFGDFDLGPSLL